MKDTITEWTIPELAQVKRVSVHNIRFWLRQGKLESIKIGRQNRITEKQWTAFVDDCSKKHTNKTKKSAKRK